jgi:hypothetical protein
MEDPYRMIARHRGLTKYLKNLTDSIVKIKVVLNGEKVQTYSYNDQVRLRTIIPKLEPKKVYSMNLFYKEEGDYYRADLKDLIVIQNENQQIDIFKNKKGFLSNPRSDYLIFGYLKKKLILQIIDMKIYNFHIHSITNDNGNGKMMNMDFFQTFCWDENKELPIETVLNKILIDYGFEIQQSSVLYDEHNGVWNVEVIVKIKSKKNWLQRGWNYLFHK